MNKLFDVVYEACKDRVVDKDSFMSALGNYELTPVYVGKELAGCLMNRGSEVHAAILENFRKRWFGKWVFRWMSSIMEREGVITTTVMSNHHAGHLFANRLGFKKVGEKDNVTIYVKEV